MAVQTAGLEPCAGLRAGYQHIACLRTPPIRRHTFISAVLHNGGDLETARDLAGHSSIVVTQAYVESTNEIKRRAVEALEY